MGLATFLAVAHQPGLLQHAKMLGHGRLRDPGLCRQGADGLFALAAEAFEDRPPGRVGERPEQDVVSNRCHDL